VVVSLDLLYERVLIGKINSISPARGITVRILVGPYLPMFLLGAGVIVVLVTGRPFLGGTALAQRHASFRSLHATSPILNILISISVIGKPLLGYLQKHDWNIDIVPSQIAMPAVGIVIVSVYALLGSFIYFFFRAIRNINFFSGSKLRSPYSAFFMLIPITNFVVIPYLEYFAYHRSQLAADPEKASKVRAAFLVVSAFTLLIIGLAYGRLSEDGALSSFYDPLSLLIVSLGTGGAGGILTSRVITGISHAQDLRARQRDLLPQTPIDPQVERQSRRKTLLQSIAVGVLLTAALITAVFPTLPSELVRAAGPSWAN
jgi:hypothetical protein